MDEKEMTFVKPGFYQDLEGNDKGCLVRVRFCLDFAYLIFVYVFRNRIYSLEKTKRFFVISIKEEIIERVCRHHTFRI